MGYSSLSKRRRDPHRERKGPSGQTNQEGPEKWDKNARKHWVEGYNKAADYSNNNFINKLNEKYKDYDFSDRTDKNTRKVYKRYVEEYVNGFNSILEKSYREVLGDRPDDPGAIRSLPFYNDADSLYQAWLNDKEEP